jgi:hypothetical protein
MLKALLLVSTSWTVMSFLSCLAWSRLLTRSRALIASAPVMVR